MACSCASLSVTFEQAAAKVGQVDPLPRDGKQHLDNFAADGLIAAAGHDSARFIYGKGKGSA